MRGPAVGEVIADQGAAGAEDPGDLHQGVAPVDDVVQHQQAHRGVEVIVVERQVGCVGFGHGDAGAVRGETSACCGDHHRIEVRCSQFNGPVSLEECPAVRSGTGADLEHLAVQLGVAQ